jgi:hypothetical protein
VAGELQTGGTLDPERHVYIERREDAELLSLLESGEYCNILSSRQVGKSSLMLKAALLLRARGRAVAIVDVAGALGSPENADEWYCGLLTEITRQLGLHGDVRAWWEARPGTANQRLLQQFREELLPSLDQDLVVFLDEIDHTLKFSYTDDFFTAIRSMYNDRPREAIFRRVTFCLAGVASPNELVKNKRTTAYNVGRTLELADFDVDRDDLSPLARAMSADPETGAAIVRAVVAWSGGHPYLTQRLCQEFLESGRGRVDEVDAMVGDAYTNLDRLSGDVHFQQIARFFQERLTEAEATCALYERILRGRRERDLSTVAHTQLKLSGLAKRDPDGNLIVRNRLYRQLFDLRWARGQLPFRRARRVRRFAAAAGVAALLLAAGIFGYNGVLQAPRAQALLTELASTSDEALARDRYARFSGEGSWPTAWLWRVWYGDRARAALSVFWQRRASAFDERAQARLKEGRTDEACILGAVAAIKRGGPLLDDVQRAFDQAGFRALQATVAVVEQVDDATFSLDGARLLLRRAGETSMVVDPQSGVVLERHSVSVFRQEFVLGLLDGRHVIDLHPALGEFRVRLVGSQPLSASRVEPSASASMLPAPEETASTAVVGRGAIPRNSSALVPAASGERFALLTAGSRGAGEIGVWDVPSGRHVFQRPVASTRDAGVTLSRSGRWLAYADQASVTIVDLEVGSSRVLTIAPASRAAFVRLSYSPDDRLLARTRVWSTSLQQATTEVWDARTGALHYTTRGILQAFSQDGRSMLVGRYAVGRDPEAVVIDTATWQDARTYAGAAGDLSPDGAVIAVSHREVVTVYTPGRSDTPPRIDGASASFSHDGTRLATISRRGTAEPFVRIWNVDPLVEREAGAAGSSQAAVTPPSPPGLTPQQRWERWQIAFGLTLDDTDQVVPLWQTRADGQAGPRAIDGIGAR